MRVEEKWVEDFHANILRTPNGVSGGIVLLVGSGISQAAPTNLATGSRVVEELVEFLCQPLESEGAQIREMVSQTSFEYILQHYPQPDRLNARLAETYSAAIPNGVHRTITAATRDGLIKHVITTNYDTALERSLTPSPLHVLTVEEDSRDLTEESRVLFKWHGCGSKPGTMVASLAQESSPPEWKSRQLRRLVAGRCLVICGYSGQDFELCPELVYIGKNDIAAGLVWNAYSRTRTDTIHLGPNAGRVISSFRESVIVRGDLTIFLSRLLNARIGARESGPVISPVGQLVRPLSTKDVLRWKIPLYIGIGATGPLLSMIGELGKHILTEAEALHARDWHAQVLFQLGRYADSRAVYRDLARIVPPRGSDAAEVDELRCIKGMISCDRATLRLESALAGIFRATRLHQQAKDGIREATCDFSLQKAEIAELPIALLMMHRWPGVGRRVRQRMRIWLSEAADRAALEGDWMILQTCARIAERIGMRPDEIMSTTTVPLGAYEGFVHLGNLRGQVMTLLERHMWTTEELQLARTLLRKVRWLQLAPETWKLSMRLMGTESNTGRRAILFKVAVRAYRTCQYPFRVAIVLAAQAFAALRTKVTQTGVMHDAV